MKIENNFTEHSFQIIFRKEDNMLGVMLNYKESQEIEYLLKRELEELLLDLTDSRIDGIVKRAMEERYKIVFGLYKRFASPDECYKYIRSKRQRTEKM